MGMYRAEVKIGLKPGVADPEGANTEKALRLLGFEGVRGVASSKLVLIDLEAKNQKEAKDEVEAMCRRLLTNPVIHAFELNILKSEATAVPVVVAVPKKSKGPPKKAVEPKAKGKSNKR
jgi:phosphoribosylformylglycinamidine synthase